MTIPFSNYYAKMFSFLDFLGLLYYYSIAGASNHITSLFHPHLVRRHGISYSPPLTDPF